MVWDLDQGYDDDGMNKLKVEVVIFYIFALKEAY